MELQPKIYNATVVESPIILPPLPTSTLSEDLSFGHHRKGESDFDDSRVFVGAICSLVQKLSRPGVPLSILEFKWLLWLFY
jgi:hypothetical protein